MSRKTQIIIWIIATIVGTAGTVDIALATVTRSPVSFGVVFLCITAALLLITAAFRPGRDGDTA